MIPFFIVFHPSLFHHSTQSWGISEWRPVVQQGLGHSPMRRAIFTMNTSSSLEPWNWNWGWDLSCFRHSFERRRWYAILPQTWQISHWVYSSCHELPALLWLHSGVSPSWRKLIYESTSNSSSWDAWVCWLVVNNFTGDISTCSWLVGAPPCFLGVDVDGGQLCPVSCSDSWPSILFWLSSLLPLSTLP